MKQTHIIVFILFLISSFTSYAQKKVSGIVEDQSGALPGASVYVKGDASTGVITDLNGRYTMQVPEKATLVFSYIGYKTLERSVAGVSVLNVRLESEETRLQNVLVVGSRVAGRSADDTPVPVDVLDLQKLNLAGPQVNVNQILNYVAPSFTSNTQTVSDGTDHIDPASLRGMGPDQVLVLINGKRRHTSSLVNVNGTAGRGNVGTDLNAIPAFAIKRIEVLRDGAAAQYGSDAIAGVINIVLKDREGLSMLVNGGARVTSNANNFEGGVDGADAQVNLNYGTALGNKGGFVNLTGSFYYRDRTRRAEPYSGSIYNAYNAIEYQARQDRFNVAALQDDVDAIKRYAAQVPHFDQVLQNTIANNAFDLDALRNALSDADGDPLNVTDAELALRGKQRSDFSMLVGQSSLRSGKFMANMAAPLGNGFEVYSFGGFSFRDGLAAGFYRRPDQNRTLSAVYPDGFLPHIRSTVNDASIAAGVRGKQGEWNLDFSNTWGRNAFNFHVENSANATMGARTLLKFNSGGFSFIQNTSNLDVSRYYKDVLSGLNLAFGLEYRYENYKINAGEEASYAGYNRDGSVALGGTSDTRDFYGRSRPAGAQVFPGFRPSNERNASRNSGAAYVDVEADVIESVVVAAAARYENYSDFGSTINFKLASRWRILDWLSVRAAGSTGFRAPSLHQLNFNTVSTNFIDGVPFEVGTFSNDSRIANLFGIQQLTNEVSFSASGGITATIPNTGIKITLDGYFIRVNDRVVLTGNFSRPSDDAVNDPDATQVVRAARAELQTLFDQAGANRGRFFANAIDTETKGADLVVTYDVDFNTELRLANTLAVGLYYTDRVGAPKTPTVLADAGLANTFFGPADDIYLGEATPRHKGTLTNILTWKKWSLFLRNVYFGSVRTPNALSRAEAGYNAGDRPVFAGKVLTDLSIGYNFNEHFNLTLGSNNIADIYPDKNPSSLSSGNQFIYSRNVSQFGFGGRYVFLRANINF